MHDDAYDFSSSISRPASDKQKIEGDCVIDQVQVSWIHWTCTARILVQKGTISPHFPFIVKIMWQIYVCHHAHR